jgi:flagellar FliJ protein
MNPSRSLEVLLEREQAERDGALAALHRAQQHAEAARAQADRLVAYRGEYQRRWSAQFARAAAIEIVQCYHGFTQRLEEAISQQQLAARHADEGVERARLALRTCEVRVASVRKLIERRAGELKRCAERREQKTADEAAQRMTWTARLQPSFH